ncbi:DUF6516 family protein [Polaromonas sp. AER18D-145]|uniref:toxin-antitoxin system TumE family protein n=1 Tax=Polaromonas sp. AER18D-145 TaxID=1977060 RepID=UPI000BBBD53F|nr:DUF6516 family protein [Polaromonas sp. AER18D-145]
MDAQLIARAKEVRNDGSIVEVVVWRVPRAIHPCTHPFNYRLYFGAGGVCRVRYDNEQGKGDHRHAGESEEPYRFESLEQLLADFQRDVENWRTSS